MQILTRTSGGIYHTDMLEAMLAKRQILLTGEIDDALAVSIVEQLLWLAAEDADASVDLLINSSGGSVEAGMLIYDAMLTSGLPIRTCCLGKAYSMAALLFASGNHSRVMLPHSKLMLHEPQIVQPNVKTLYDLESLSGSMKETRDQILEILSLHSSKPLEVVRKASSYDHFMSAQEAIDFGLADAIVPLKEMVPQIQ